MPEIRKSYFFLQARSEITQIQEIFGRLNQICLKDETLLVQHLHPVADTEDRQTSSKYICIVARGVDIIDRARTPCDDNRLEAVLLQLVHGGLQREELAVHVLLPHTPIYQLGELRSRVQDGDLVKFSRSVHFQI